VKLVKDLDGFKWLMDIPQAIYAEAVQRSYNPTYAGRIMLTGKVEDGRMEVATSMYIFLLTTSFIPWLKRMGMFWNTA